MNRVLRWLVLPAVLFGSMLVFSSSEADAFWGRRASASYCGYSCYSPCSTGTCWSGYNGYATYASYVPSCGYTTSCYTPTCTTGCATGCSTGFYTTGYSSGCSTCY